MENKCKYKAQDNWQKKSGYITKSFKMKKDIVDLFVLKCNELEISQSKMLSQLILELIKN